MELKWNNILIEFELWKEWYLWNRFVMIQGIFCDGSFSSDILFSLTAKRRGSGNILARV